MALCTVTGAVYFPSGELARSVTIKFSRVDKSVNAEYLGAVVPADVFVKTGRLGQVDFQILTGKYIMAVGEYSGGAVVPEELTANIADILTIVTPSIPVPAWLAQALAARDVAIQSATEAGIARDQAVAAATPYNDVPLTNRVIALENEPAVTWDTLTNKPATFPPAAHTHTIAQVVGLRDELDDLAGPDEFATPANVTIARPVVQRARDSVSALDLMSAGGLDEAVRNRAVTNADASAITAALQEGAQFAATSSRALLVPAGSYLLNAQILATQPLVMLGDGPLATRLRWIAGSASEGISVVPTSRVDQTRVCSMALETYSLNTRTGINIDYSAFPVISPSGAWRIGQPLMAYTDDLLLRGATNAATDGWQYGIDAQSLVGMSLRDSKIQGVSTAVGTMPLTSDAVRFGGPGDAIQLIVDGLMVSSYQNGVHAVNSEGVYINKSEFVTVGCGFRSTNEVGETGFWFTGSHVATVSKGISVQRNGDGWIKDNLFFGSGPATPLTFIELLDGSSNIDIEGNSFRRAPSSGQVVTSVDIQGGSNNRVRRNYHQIGAGGTAVKISSGTLRTKVSEQQFDQDMVAPYNDGSTGTIYELRPKYAGSLDNIVIPAEGGDQTHLLTVGATGFPSDWAAPEGGIVRTVANQGGLAMQFAYQPNIGAVASNQYQRRRSGGTWRPWVRLAGVAV